MSPPLRIAITLGDPAGVGPELVLRYFRDRDFPPGTAPFAVGEGAVLAETARLLGNPTRIESLDEPPRETPEAGLLPVIEPRDHRFGERLEPGRVSAACGAAAWAWIRRGVELVQSGQADALVTGPIHKEALQAAGCPYTGHTTMLEAMAGGAPVTMLLTGGGLRCALATIHKPLSSVPGLITREGLLDQLRLMDGFLPWFGLERRPRIAVCGLNPHAGEGGLFGREEIETIAPAVADARAEGIDADGPLPGDTVFHFHREGDYDAVLAMYHDQALIPVKTLDFHGGVNVTLGLPYIRCSVDHGTAFNIAGQGRAHPGSLRAAVACAALLAANRFGPR